MMRLNKVEMTVTGQGILLTVSSTSNLCVPSLLPSLRTDSLFAGAFCLCVQLVSLMPYLRSYYIMTSAFDYLRFRRHLANMVA